MYVPVLALLIALLLLPAEAQAVPGTLRVEIQGEGRVTGPGVDCTATCSVPADRGRALKAADRPGYTFSNWLGCRAGTGGTSPDCFVDAYAPVVTAIATFRDVQAPSVALAEPPSGPRRGVVGLAATASDNAGVSRVEFRVRGATVGSDGAAPFETRFDTAGMPDGLVTVQAVAFDAAGNASAQERRLTIDNTVPAHAAVGPSNRPFPPGAELTWTLNARDASGIASVECGVAASTTMPSFGPCSGGLESHSTRIETPGRYAFFTRATDAAGNVTALEPLEFTIDPGAAPPAGPAAGAFLPIVRNSFRTVGPRTLFVALNATNLPEGSRAVLACRGPGCTFKQRRFTARDGRISLLPTLKRRKLRTGARLAVRVIGPAGQLKVVTFTMRRGKPPRKTVGCAPAGGGRLRACD
jgi:hypothetical protein